MLDRHAFVVAFLGLLGKEEKEHLAEERATRDKDPTSALVISIHVSRSRLNR